MSIIATQDTYQEGLCIIVEDAARLGPVAVGTGTLEETVALLEEEVVLNKLLALGLHC